MSAVEGQLPLAGLGPSPEPAPAPAAPEPTPEQRAAVAARDRDVFLEAGAGTGKTSVLVDRYCAAIVDDGAEVEQILAFTFTERAAAEMRTRIRAELAERAALARDGGESALAGELLRAARATERAWVMTIHAFCRRLLAAHPLAAGLDPRFRVLDAAEAARLEQRAVNEALDELLASGDEAVAWATAAYRPWRITAMAIAAHARLRSQGMSEPRLPPVAEPVHSPSKKEEQRPLTSEELEAAEHARSALERSPSLAESWRERFAHILVDEFQDTNSVQLRLVELLRGPQTRLFTVGDEQQSIYRFRNADLEVFRGERREATASPTTEVLPLRGNFRSLPAVLAGVNDIGRTLLDGFTELTAGRPSEDGRGAVELLLTLDEGRGRDARKWAQEEIDLEPPPGGSPAHNVAEARFLAERLRQLVDAGEATRGEIVVLLRAFTHVDAYEESLRRAGLRPFVVGGRGYWTQQQVEDLIRLLGVVSNPLDDEFLFGALACFANDVSPDALWLLRRAASDESGRPRHVWPLVAWRYGDGRDPGERREEWLEQVPKEDASRLERFCAILARLRAEAPLLTLEALIERTMNAFGYDLGLLAREGGIGRMANVRKLMRLAREYEANEGRDLAGFLALAAESTERDAREGMAAVQAEGHDGVRVMTVHAAKGLQFPVVAVPDLGRRLNAGSPPIDVAIGPPDAEGPGRRFGMRLAFPSAGSLGLWELADLGTAESEADAEEGCRLVYVAASRAEDRLILSGVFGPKDVEPAEERKPGDTPLRRILPRLAERGFGGADCEIALPGPEPVDGSGRLEEGALTIRVNEPGAARAVELVRTFPPPEEPDPLAGAGAPPPLLEAGTAPVPVGHLSYSAVALYERCGYRFYVERVLGARESRAAPPALTDDEGAETEAELGDPSAGRGVSLGIGNAVHAALEWSAARRWEVPEPALLERLLTREGLHRDEEVRARVERLVGGWLGSPLLAELRGSEARAEVPFVVGIGGTVVRGQIDVLVPTPDGPPVVIDYKTDALDGRRPAELGDRYRAQREIYALAAGDERGAEAIHVFLEAPDEPVRETFDVARIASARSRLEGLIEGMRSGEFAPTESPYEALCFGCPAAERLCPVAQWKPSWSAR